MIRLARYAQRLLPFAVTLSLLLAVVSAAAAIALPVLTGQAVGALPAALAGGPVTRLLGFATALVVSLLVVQAIEAFRQVVVNQLSEALEQDLTLRTGRALSIDPDLTTLDNPDVAAKVERLRGRAWEIRMGAQMVVANLPRQMLALLGTAVALGVVLTWWIAVIMVAAAFGTALFLRRIITSQMDVWTGNTEPQKHADYAFTQAMGASAKEVRIFGLAEFLRLRFRDNMLLAYRPYWRRRNRQLWLNIVIFGGRTALTAAAAAYAGWLASTGRLDLTALATALPLVLALGGADLWAIAQIQRGVTAHGWLEDLDPTLARADHERSDQEQGDRDQGVQEQGDREQGDRGRGRTTEPLVAVADRSAHDLDALPTHAAEPPAVVFDDVTFHYPGQDQPILDRLTLELPSGEATALVGVNGAGKSTFVKLLAAAYLPTRGRILVDGQDLARFDVVARRAWQRRIAPVTQDFARLALPAGDNVELGSGRVWVGGLDADPWPGADELDRIAARAGITDLIERLPRGWATVLDKTLPGGTDLSGGEWQRVALARALRAVDAGAQVLVLDEPAAALDVESESRLVAGYLDLARHVTSLVISHRFSVVRPVPRILVLEHGRIVETGSHAELMTIQGGRYREMFTLQASRYVDAVDAAEVVVP